MAAKKKASTRGTQKKKKKATAQAPPKSKVSAKLLAPPVEGQDPNKLRQGLKEFMASFNRDAGHKVVAFADEVPNTYELRRPSGIMQLDIDTGGGIPSGGLSYISGPDNAGKTYLIMLYMLMHQKLYGQYSSIAYGCVEGGFDFRRAINMGLKIAVPDEVVNQWDKARQLRGMPAYTKDEWKSFKEQTGEFVILRGNTGEELLETVLGAVQTRLFGIIAVDSVSVILPAPDAEKDLSDPNKYAGRANLITDFITHYTPLTSGLDGLNYTTLIFVSQVRANKAKAEAASFMQRYMKDWAATGAWAPRHIKLLDITLWSGQSLKKTVQGKKSVIGKVMHWEISKGKAGTHDNIQGDVPFYYEFYNAAGVDRVDSVITAGMRSGVIVERGGKVHVIRPETGNLSDIRDIPSVKSLGKMMEVDFDFELAVRREVLASRGIQCLYR
jgi:RecA/RadA recombinase